MTSNSFSYALINGTVIPFASAQVSLAHPVFLSSFGVYESIQINQGNPFHLQNHLQRLQTSAKMIEINLPPIEIMLNWGIDLLHALPRTTYALQILVLGDETSSEPPLIAFIPKPIRTYPLHFFIAGAKAITYPGQRALPECKSFNTLINHLARIAAHQANAIEAILTHNNLLFEGARSNIFAVEAATNRLITPPAGTVLSGITRDTVIQVMQNTDYPVHSVNLPADTPFSELFITSTSMHVLPITNLNTMPVGNGQVGPVTKLAMSQFEKYYAAYQEHPNFL